MICGIINHALGRKELIFIPDNFEHDASLSISALHDHLVRMLLETKMRPEEFHFQGDNSGKDNKNRYLFAYCAVRDKMIFITNLTFVVVGTFRMVQSC